MFWILLDVINSFRDEWSLYNFPCKLSLDGFKQSFLHVTFFPLAVKSYIDIRKVNITAKFQCLKRDFI